MARPRPAPKSTKIFFGNKAFYCFFRLYQIIYDRLTSAKEMEKNSDKKKWAASILTPPKEMLGATSDGEKKDPYQVRCALAAHGVSGALFADSRFLLR
jgi:histone deacetylase complex regulatory component SIN3